MRTLLVALLALLFGCASARAEAGPAQVLVVPSLHGFHKAHPGYDFDTLYALVADFRPDIVGVEIRPEDIDEPDSYLARNYPPEMIELRNRYNGRAAGFDWLGDDIAGRPIPTGWWKSGSPIKALERQMANDPAMKDPEADRIAEAQKAVLESATPGSLTDGRYTALVRRSHARMAELAGTGPYSELVRFTQERDRRIDARMIEIVRDHPGKRIVFVTGADHFGPAVETLRSALGTEARIIVPE